MLFTDANNGTAVGGSGAIYRTTDGGVTWTHQDHPQTNSGRYYAVFFTDVNTGTVVGDNGAILKTTDGGNTWNVQSSGVNTQLNAVFLTNPMSGWVAGNGGILHTATGGEAVEVP